MSNSWLPSCKVLSLFNAEECAEFLDEVSASTFRQAQSVSPEGIVSVKPDHARFWTKGLFPGNPIYERISTRVWDHLEEINARYHFTLHDTRERVIPSIAFNLYDGNEEGQVKFHVDTGEGQGLETRKLSLSILMNDGTDYLGGDFVVKTGTEDRPLATAVAGEAVVFPSFNLHCVEPVTRGKRWSVVVWLHGPKFR